MYIKMHFSIPETVDRRDPKGSVYTVYEIHINGVRHCSLRYRQLHTLHEKLKREFHPLPSFPPKKLMALSLAQLEERRLNLEKYLQLLSQDPRVSNGIVFNGFLLAAQQETASEKSEEVDLDVFLMNDSKTTVRGLTILQTEEVLEKVCQQLGVPDEFVYYFALFLVQRDETTGKVSILRKLQDYESPYISQKSFVRKNASCKLVLRKSSWDSRIDDQLLKHKVTLNLLYIQTLSDVERGWVQACPETRRQLAHLQSRGAKEEYMEMARQLKDYGYIHFDPCTCDYPMTNTDVDVLIGGRELIIRIPAENPTNNVVSGAASLESTSSGSGFVGKEGKFKVTKMRCWRIMTLAGVVEAEENSSEIIDGETTVIADSNLELSFEYLMPSGELQWVTIVSSQAILISLCLQTMVEELLRLRNEIPIKRAGEKSCTTQFSFKKRDGSEMIIPIRSGLHSVNLKSHDGNCPDNKSMTSRQYSVRKLSEKFVVVNMRDTSRAAENVFVENEAFQELKDDDL